MMMVMMMMMMLVLLVLCNDTRCLSKITLYQAIHRCRYAGKCKYSGNQFMLRNYVNLG